MRQEPNKNSTRSTQPKAGDGTQDVRKRQDANWYGQSQEPQEEFVNDHEGDGARSQHGPVSAAEPSTKRTSEGSPFDADSGRDLLTPERAANSDSNSMSDVENKNRH